MSEAFVVGVVPVEAVVRLAEKVPVFPCRRSMEEINGELFKDKSPLTTNGLYDATRDPDRIRAWWNRWPDALVGVPMGAATGLIAVDYDPGKLDGAGEEWVKDNADSLVAAKIHETRSGGKHYLFKQPKGIAFKNGTNLELGGVKRGGIDLRADGGYVIWWPAHGGNQMGVYNPLPAGLVDEYRQPPPNAPQAPSPASPAKWERDRPLVADALAYVSPIDRDDWRNIGFAIHYASGGSDSGFELWHAWASGGINGGDSGNYQGIEDCRYHWASFKTDAARPIRLGTLFKRAADSGYVYPRATEGLPPPWNEDHVPRGTIEPPPDEEEAAGPLKIVSLADFATADLPPVSFVASPILPRGHVTLLGAHGEAGKSYLSLVFAAQVAIGGRFADMQFLRGRTLVVSLEDEAALGLLRLRRICEAYEIDPTLMAAQITMVDAGDSDETALAFEVNEHGVRRLHFTHALKQVDEFAAGHDLIVIDNTSDAYDADEIMRRMVRQFIRGLRRIAKKHNAAVLLLAHIDKQGARSGTNGETYSGSTAWHNSVRSRLAILQGELGTELVHEKCNLAKKLDQAIVLTRNDHGVPMPMSSAERATAESADHRAVFQAIKACLLDGTIIPCAVTGPNTSHSVLSGRPEFPEALLADKGRFKRAMLTLERENAIQKASYRTTDYKERQKWVSASVRQ